MSAKQAARLVYIFGGRNIDPRTLAYIVAKIERSGEHG